MSVKNNTDDSTSLNKIHKTSSSLLSLLLQLSSQRHKTTQKSSFPPSFFPCTRFKGKNHLLLNIHRSERGVPRQARKKNKHIHKLLRARLWSSTYFTYSQSGIRTHKSPHVITFFRLSFLLNLLIIEVMAAFNFKSTRNNTSSI